MMRLTAYALLASGCSGLGDATVLPQTPPPPPAPASAPETVCDRVVEDFSSGAEGEFPAGWRTREEEDLPLAKQQKLWVVESAEGRRVLRGRFVEKAVTIARPVPDWDLDQHPILSWEWKAVTLPAGADETRANKNDSAASVYVIWEIGFPFMVDGIRYAWSSTLPVGTRASKRLGHDKIVIVESGPDPAGGWRRVQVDVRSDHAELFSRDRARPPAGIALLTDADATRSEAEAYYADFRLCRIR
jgi:hypothetical protein